MEAEVLVNTICPSPEELSVIVKSVRCLECGLEFQNEPRLRLHDLKVHKQGNLAKNDKKNIQYHCPVSSCVYALKSERYFTTMKYLKQHYLKVHAAKTFMCTQCSKCFSTEAAKDAHVRICGVQFTCNCLKVFSTYEALLTHAKRYKHIIDNKYKLLLKKTKLKTLPAVQVTIVNVGKPVNILPNSIDGSNTYTYLMDGKLKVTCDAAMQTDEFKRAKKVSSPLKSVAARRRISQQTQTGGLKTEKHHKTSAETQTNERYIMTKSTQQESNSHMLKDWKCRKSELPKDLNSTILKEDLNFADNFETQNLFSNSPLPLSHDVGLQDLWEVKNTSGTQTNEENFLEDLNENVTQTDLNIFYNHDEPTLMHSGSQTTNLNNIQYIEDNSIGNTLSFARIGSVGHTDSLLMEKMFDNKFSSIETQTELAFTRELFDQDTSFTYSSNTETQTTESFENMDELLYSNTCTQTSDEILLSDLGFSDIQTQTAWPQISDATVSTETQTKISKSVQNDSSIGRSWLHAQTNHMETQTELLNFFRDLN
ncbi:uncharacterized protein LOC107219373 [Neodiprion lecontei]|uniref:Uncharacterized protein LOC107219373 n=1 Tax=Neodiprion lecontei TaxID=441921 RepID=A0A6J0BF77_NEOLC|nr:uncharacterized protein LOC107219373 [Neodiprion lecontei]